MNNYKSPTSQITNSPMIKYIFLHQVQVLDNYIDQKQGFVVELLRLYVTNSQDEGT